jgi:WD40 repeat protein
VARIGAARFRATPAGATEDVAFLPGSLGVVSVHGGAEVAFWDAVTGLRTRTISGPAGAGCVEVTPAGRLVVAGASEVWAWDLGAGVPRLRWKWGTELDPGQRLTALACSPDGKFVAVGDPAGARTLLLDAGTGCPISELNGQPTGLVFSPDGKVLAAVMGRDAARPGRVAFWDAATAEPGRVVDAPAHVAVAEGVFSPDGRTFVWLGTLGTAAAVEVATGREVATWRTARRGLAFAPGGGELIAAGLGRIQFLDSAAGTETRPAVAAPGLSGGRVAATGSRGRRVSADGSYLATARKGVVGVWSVATGRQAGPGGQFPAGVSAAALSPDGRTVATFADVSAEVALWDAATGEPIRVLAAGSNPDDRCFGLGWVSGQ